MHYLMTDIETFSVAPNAHILSVAAATFDEESILTRATWRLSDEAQLSADIDSSTVLWWMQQSDEAKDHIFNSPVTKMPAFTKEFTKFVSGHTEAWANGPEFDYVILQNLFNRHNAIWPIKFWNYHSCRTGLRRIAREDLPLKPTGAHDPIVDVEYQIQCLQYAWKNGG
jgi:hypothetical protein